MTAAKPETKLTRAILVVDPDDDFLTLMQMDPLAKQTEALTANVGAVAQQIIADRGRILSGIFLNLDVSKPDGLSVLRAAFFHRPVTPLYIIKDNEFCIVTDEDPYDDNPQTIIDDVASAVHKTGKEEWKNLFKILNRKDAIEKAITLAQPGDLILITGKGSEQGMVVKGQIIPWDDRKIVREALKKTS